MSQMLDLPPQEQREHRTSHLVATTAIISCTIVMLACIFSFTIVAVFFFRNPPW